MSILELKNVAYRYDDADKNDYCLNDINYKFDIGKSYAIKGPSGSGKTTLLSLISGLEKKYEGSIKYNGEELNKLNLDTYRNTNVGIVFQSYNLLPHLTAVENIILSMDINGMKIDNKRDRAIELMKKVGLRSSFADRRVLKLSGGEQQRVAIARSLSYNPNIILADEPTGNLDEQTENDIMEIFTGLTKDQDKCVIVVTHSDNVCNFCNKIYSLS